MHQLLYAQLQIQLCCYVYSEPIPQEIFKILFSPAPFNYTICPKVYSWFFGPPVAKDSPKDPALSALILYQHLPVCLVTLLWDSLMATLAVAVHCLVKQIGRWSNRVQPAPEQDKCLPKPFICHLPVSIFTCVTTPMQVSMCLPEPHCFPFSHK